MTYTVWFGIVNPCFMAPDEYMEKRAQEKAAEVAAQETLEVWRRMCLDLGAGG